jgi:hypothetical protein
MAISAAPVIITVRVQPTRRVERCALRSGNVHSADGWRAVLEPVVARYQGIVKRLYFRGDAAFANPEIYAFLETEGAGYTIPLRWWSRAHNVGCASTTRQWRVSFHTLKTEGVHHGVYATRAEARRDLFHYIEAFKILAAPRCPGLLQPSSRRAILKWTSIILLAYVAVVGIMFATW